MPLPLQGPHVWRTWRRRLRVCTGTMRADSCNSTGDPGRIGLLVLSCKDGGVQVKKVTHQPIMKCFESQASSQICAIRSKNPPKRMRKRVKILNALENPQTTAGTRHTRLTHFLVSLEDEKVPAHWGTCRPLQRERGAKVEKRRLMAPRVACKVQVLSKYCWVGCAKLCQADIV